MVPVATSVVPASIYEGLPHHDSPSTWPSPNELCPTRPTGARADNYYSAR